MSSGLTGLVRRCGMIVGTLGLLGTLAVSEVSANVYASDLRFSTHAVNANMANPSVDLRFRLNEPADLELRIEIYRADNNALVRSANLPVPVPAGLNTWTWDLKDNASNLVPKKLEYYFKVLARANGYSKWTQISADSTTSLQYVNPRSIDVNKDPNHPDFGRIFVLEAVGGTALTGRNVTKGVFALNADYTDAIGQGNTARSGSVTWNTAADSSLSPLNLNVGPDGKVYLYDWSTSNQGVFVAPSSLDIPDGQTSWTALLAPGAANHARISGGVVSGKGLNRTLFTIDLNKSPVGSIWRYGIGALDKTFQGAEILHHSNPPSVNANITTHTVRDSLGNFYLTQTRADGHDIPSLWKVSADGQSVLWRSTEDWGIVDLLRGNNGSGVAVDNTNNRMVTPSAGLARATVFSFDPAGSPDLKSAVALGNTSLYWVFGDNSTIQYSSNTGSAFTAQTAPEAGVVFNDIHVDQSGTGTVINGFAVGNAGKIARITGRTTFTSETSPVTNNLNGVTTIRTVPHAWAVGDGGAILFRASTAAGWVSQATPVTTDLNSIAYRQLTVGANPTYTLAACGDGGVLLRKASTDPAFTLEASPVSVDLYDITMNTNARTASFQPVVVFAVGAGGAVVRCDDLSSDTRIWSTLTSPTTKDLYAAYLVTTKAVWIVGQDGFIARTVDSGQTWEIQNSGTPEDLREVYFADMQNGCAVGDNGTLLTTEDGGNTWTSVGGFTANLNGVFGAGIGTFNGLRGVAFDAVGNLYLGSTDLDWVRVYSPPDGENSFTTTSPVKFIPADGSEVKPTTPTVNSPALTNIATELSADWNATGVEYRYAISVTPDDQGEYVVGWTNTTNTSVTVSNLSLVSGAKYFFFVQARSATGVWSNIGVSGGTLVIESTTIGEAKAKPDGSLVSLENVMVTKSDPDAFWVQEQNRSAGIKVISTKQPALGAVVSIIGNVSTAGGIRILTAADEDISGSETGPVAPLMIQNKAVAGEKATGSAGLANDSLLVTVFGSVTAVDYAAGVFYVDDGSGALNDTPNATQITAVKGIKIIPGDLNIVPLQGQYVKITGVVGIETAGSSIIRTILTRDSSDQVVE